MVIICVILLGVLCASVAPGQTEGPSILTTSPHQDRSGRPPPVTVGHARPCPARQYESKALVYSTYIEANQPYYNQNSYIHRRSMDYLNKQFTFTAGVTVIHAKTFPLNVTLDYNSQKVYIAWRDNKYYCKVYSTDDFPDISSRDIIPANAQYWETVNLGYFLPVSAENWYWRRTQPLFGGDVDVFTDLIIEEKPWGSPVQTYSGWNIGNLLNATVATTFFNTTNGIQDRRVFDIPPDCSSSTPMNVDVARATADMLLD